MFYGIPAIASRPGPTTVPPSPLDPRPQVRIVKHAFDIIHLLTDQNPIQVVVDAIINRWGESPWVMGGGATSTCGGDRGDGSWGEGQHKKLGRTGKCVGGGGVCTLFALLLAGRMWAVG